MQLETISIEIEEIPHGHGASFKKGVADGLLESHEHEQTLHVTHAATYRRGIKFGEKLKTEIARLVKQ